MLIDGPAAGSIVEAGDPPIRRGVIVLADTAFAEAAYRYYLSSVDTTSASYTYGGRVEWPPEAASQMIRRPTDSRTRVADQIAPAAELNGD